jgi:Ca2+-binding EF-hand superfamily protein
VFEETVQVLHQSLHLLDVDAAVAVDIEHPEQLGQNLLGRSLQQAVVYHHELHKVDHPVTVGVVDPEYMGLTELQVEEKFQAFLKDHPDGKLRKKDFRSMMSEALPKKDAEKLEPHVFRIYDTNSDGVIDFVEFMVVYYCLLEGSPEEVLTKLFRVFDVNSDGSINIKEMKRLVKDLYGLLKHNDPTTASEELIAKTAFKEMDVNGDGLVSQDEFVRAVLEQEQFSKLLTVNIMSIFIDATE